MTLVDDAQMQGNRLERIVLVAEDQQAQRDQIAGYLRSIGVGVIEARVGAEASTAIIEQRPAVVLMDINMPGLDGIRAAKLCATVTPKPKIILMSGYDDLIRNATEEHLPVFAVVNKPIPLRVRGRFVVSALAKI